MGKVMLATASLWLRYAMEVFMGGSQAPHWEAFMMWNRIRSDGWAYGFCDVQPGDSADDLWSRKLAHPDSVHVFHFDCGEHGMWFERLRDCGDHLVRDYLPRRGNLSLLSGLHDLSGARWVVYGTICVVRFLLCSDKRNSHNAAGRR